MGYIDINDVVTGTGQETSANSNPVVIASDQTTIPVNLTNSSGTSVGTMSNPLFVNSTTSTGRSAVNQYAEIMSVASGSTTTIVQYTVPSASSFVLERVSASGENIAMYQVLVNGTAIETQRSNFGAQLNCEFNFISSGSQGYILNVGDVVSVTVLHNRPYTANFEGRIQMSMTS